MLSIVLQPLTSLAQQKSVGDQNQTPIMKKNHQEHIEIKAHQLLPSPPFSHGRISKLYENKSYLLSRKSVPFLSVKYTTSKSLAYDICKRDSSLVYYPRRHNTCIHSSLKPYSCPKCGKNFKRRDHVMKHLNKKNPCRKS